VSCFSEAIARFDTKVSKLFLAKLHINICLDSLRSFVDNKEYNMYIPYLYSFHFFLSFTLLRTHTIILYKNARNFRTKLATKRFRFFHTKM